MANICRNPRSQRSGYISFSVGAESQCCTERLTFSFDYQSQNKLCKVITMNEVKQEMMQMCSVWCNVFRLQNLVFLVTKFGFLGSSNFFFKLQSAYNLHLSGPFHNIFIYFVLPRCLSPFTICIPQALPCKGNFKSPIRLSLQQLQNSTPLSCFPSR